MDRIKILLAALLCGITLLFSACGYALEGRGSFLPPHIVRIGIPTFTNKTTVATLAQEITSSIYSEFITRGNFVLTQEASNVDALLTGEIVSFAYVPRALDEDGIATQFLIVITANITFRDVVDDRILWQQENYQFQSEYQLSELGSDFIDQELESLRLAARDFAQSVVSNILTGF